MDISDWPPLGVTAFTEAMAGHAASVAVITTRTPDGKACGLLVSTLCSYSVDPPSVLFAVGRSARSYPALTGCAAFGVHLLDRGHRELADIFAGRVDDKFAAVAWRWHGPVPRLDGVPQFLTCRTRRVVPDGDHAVMIGGVVALETDDDTGPVRDDPLIYYRRRLGSWETVFGDSRSGALTD
ncbi:hypothetical protein GCM10010172_03340 [Paractinoplanes ferrugineus]|uniref:Flavin reductase like domain-containing protein n=1 Tax=Paractinoplanes ferrugineus TaxID=113564 RepID=A0A919J4Z6_9ACTN|nr:flavin reductase family protein [Actinoplanes ferrugineus]GIE13739.1 hypothetical protein Afe05nite_55790 [Actinoplanes ferrugineus]